MAGGTLIGMRIKRRRQALGMEQKDLAALVGVARATVANWESGKHFPLRKQGAIEEALGISLDENPGPLVSRRVREAIEDDYPPERAGPILANLEAYLRGEPPPGTSGPAGGRREEQPAAS